jgi:hypothetical protein
VQNSVSALALLRSVRTLKAEQEARRAEQITHKAGAILLHQLTVRGFEVPRSVREMIKVCGDIDQIDHWSERARTAATLENVFDLARR